MCNEPLTSASVDAIKSAYRKLSKRSHPDAGGSEADFIALRKLYEDTLERPPRLADQWGRCRSCTELAQRHDGDLPLAGVGPRG